jgi:hypothetical protein
MFGMRLTDGGTQKSFLMERELSFFTGDEMAKTRMTDILEFIDSIAATKLLARQLRCRTDPQRYS